MLKIPANSCTRVLLSIIPTVSTSLVNRLMRSPLLFVS